ncbi:MAG TPA: hypothetical protein VJH75_03635, partial [Patescibacteria group bacterium]|nr:hypothetical protein [Patescibacteria group bacterium]
EGWWLVRPEKLESHGVGPQIAVKLWDITIAPSLHPRWNDGEFGLDFLLKFGLSFGPHPAEAPPAESLPVQPQHASPE